MGIHRSLTDDEIIEFRDWARNHYKIGSKINPLWHPVVKEECERMNHLMDHE